MSTFAWRIFVFFMILFLILAVANITVTLMVVFDIKNGSTINQNQLTFVEACNFIFAGVLLAGFLGALIGTPIILYFQRKNNRWIESGLRPADIRE